MQIGLKMEAGDCPTLNMNAMENYLLSHSLTTDCAYRLCDINILVGGCSWAYKWNIFSLLCVNHWSLEILDGRLYYIMLEASHLVPKLLYMPQCNTTPHVPLNPGPAEFLLLILIWLLINNYLPDTDHNWVVCCKNVSVGQPPNRRLLTLEPFSGGRLDPGAPKRVVFLLLVRYICIHGLEVHNIVKKKSIFFMMYSNFLNKPLFWGVPTDHLLWHQWKHDFAAHKSARDPCPVVSYMLIR